MFRILALILLLLGSCAPAPPAPLSRSGVLDLRAVNFGQELIPLAGEWAYFPGIFLDPGAVSPPGVLAPEILSVPGPLKTRDGQALPVPGAGTWQLEILLPHPGPWTVRMPNIQIASRVYVNGTYMGSQGQPTLVPGQGVPSSDLLFFTFQAPDHRARLLVHNANWWALDGGMGLEPKIGPQKVVSQKRTQDLNFTLFISGVLVMMGLYHLGLYFFRREDPAPLLFGLICLLMTVRHLITGERVLLEMFPQTLEGWNWALRLELISAHATLPLFGWFFQRLFPRQVRKGVVLGLTGVTGLWILLQLLTPSTVYLQVLHPFEFFLLAGASYYLFTLLWAWASRESGALIILGGLVLMLVTVVNDVLLSSGFIRSQFLSSLGLAFFLFAQSFFLARNFSRTYRRAERLKQDLEEKNLRLEDLDRVKDHFLANTSHELRTPLNGIIGLAESLLDGVEGRLPPRMTENLTMIAASGRRLAALVNDILDYSRLQTRDLELAVKPLALAPVVSTVLQLLKPLILGKEVDLVSRVPKNLWVKADENRLMQILLNLAGNGVKFTPSGRVEIEAQAADQEILICVRDTGIGIPEDRRQRIFQAFEQGDSSIARKYGGTGLGLSISKKLVELHGGRIWFQSPSQGGTEFFFTLPPGEPQEDSLGASEGPEARPELLDPPETPVLETLVPERTHNQSFRILVVDDEPVNLQVLYNFLSMENYRVTTISDPRAAWEILQRESFDLGIFDVMMPEISGYELCRLVRKSATPAAFPVILLTARNLVHDMVEGFQSGANDYLLKPVAKLELLSRVKNHLQLAHSHKFFSRFVPLEFLGLLKRESLYEVELGDQVQGRMTIFFSDIRSFSRISEALGPQKTFQFINQLFKVCGPVVRHHRGFIDKFIGDAVMAVFPRTPADALAAALETQEALHLFNARQEAGEPIRIGIGLHTGEVMLGTIGEAQRMEGTVISDAVNVASRLQDLSKTYLTDTIMSEEVYLTLPAGHPFQVRCLGTVPIKGRLQTVKIYELLHPRQEGRLASRSAFEEGVRLLSQKQWSPAVELFRGILEQDPQDSPAQYFLRLGQERL